MMIILIVLAAIVPVGFYLRWATLPLRLGFLCGMQAERMRTGRPARGLRNTLRFLARRGRHLNGVK